MHTAGTIIYDSGLIIMLLSILPLFGKRHDPITTIRRTLGRLALVCLIPAVGGILLHKYFAMALCLILAAVFAWAWRHYRHVYRGRD